MLKSTLKKSVYLVVALSVLQSGAPAKDKTGKSRNLRIAQAASTMVPTEMPAGTHVDPIFEQLNQHAAAEAAASADRGIPDSASISASMAAGIGQPLPMTPVPVGMTMPVQQPVFYLYEFSADWCPSCQVLKPHVERLAQMYSAAVKFVPINIDNPGSKGLVKKLGINSIPTLVIYDPTAKAMRVMVGLQQGMQLERVLTDSLREKGQPTASTQ